MSDAICKIQGWADYEKIKEERDQLKIELENLIFQEKMIQIAAEGLREENLELTKENDELKAKLKQSEQDAIDLKHYFQLSRTRAEQAEANLERTDSHLARALAAQIALTTRAEQAEAKVKRLREIIQTIANQAPFHSSVKVWITPLLQQALAETEAK